MLVFLPGAEEIRRCRAMLEKSLPGNTVLQELHGSLPFAEQKKVLAPPPAGVPRRIILSTNVAESSLTISGITLDDQAKTVTVDGEPVNLTPTEYAILHLLMRNPGKVYSTKSLYESVWNEAALGSEGAVAVHIRHLREKLEINPSEPRYIKVVWGQGYKMEGGAK